MQAIPVGHFSEQKRLVTSDVAVDFLGDEDARVLGTPWLIMFLEMTARNAIKPLLDDGYDSVGTEVCVKHLAPSPLGMSVTFRAEVVAIQDKRIRFKVEAHDEKEKIAEGTHERAVINVSRFVVRLSEKRAGA